MTPILLRAALATLAAFGGGVLGVALGHVSPRRMRLLVFAALAALGAVTFLDVLPEAKALLPWPAFLAAVASGYALFWLVGRFVSPLCPACAVGTLDHAAGPGPAAGLLLAAMGLHSAMDGVAIAVGDEVAGHPNLALLLAVSLHKLPEGLALALLLLGAGWGRRAALGWTLGIESTTLGGALLGLAGLPHISPAWLGLVFAHVGGGFAYLIVTTLSAGRPARRGKGHGKETGRRHETPELHV